MPETIEQLTYNKFLVEESTLNFTRYFFKKRYQKKFIVNEHHERICDALDKVVRGEIKKLIINIAPRYGKTELAVKNFMAYGLAINPASRFIHLSYSDDLALDNSEEVKDMVKMPEYQQMFGNVRIKPRSDSKKKWYTTEGGGVYATSAAGQVTGFGAGTVDVPDYDNSDFEFIKENNTAKFSGALIIDDPIKPEDADSPVTRTRINERWDSTIKNRVNSRNTPIIIIMQRLHEEDLCGYLMAQSPGEWTVLSFPCIKPDNTALWAFKHNLEELQKLRDENENVFERQYQQDPKPLKGQLFRKDLIKRFTMSEFEEQTIKKDKDGNDVSLIESTLGYIDPAEGGEDFLSFPLAKIIPGKVFITNVIFTQNTVEVSVPACAKLIIEKSVNYVRVEKNGNGSGIIRDLKRIVAPDKILSAHNATHKGTRIWNEYGFILNNFYFLHESEYMRNSDYDKFMRNIFSYMKIGDNQIDDAPDSIAGLSRFIQAEPNVKELFT